eukprot:scaffold25332_cov186-Cylindrotheca_fusiformis.AAC.1
MERWVLLALQLLGMCVAGASASEDQTLLPTERHMRELSSCAGVEEEQQTGHIYMEVEGRPSDLQTGHFRVLEDALVSLYAASSEENCDEGYRHLTGAKVNRNSIPSSNQIRTFVIDFEVSGRCKGCSDNLDFFSSSRRRATRIRHRDVESSTSKKRRQMSSKKSSKSSKKSSIYYGSAHAEDKQDQWTPAGCHCAPPSDWGMEMAFHQIISEILDLRSIYEGADFADPVSSLDEETDAPTSTQASPTLAPVAPVAPTPPPVVAPTPAPVVAPTPPPVVAPTPAPVVTPTEPPNSDDSAQPTALQLGPTDPPVSGPTENPAQTPVPNPNDSVAPTIPPDESSSNPTTTDETSSTPTSATDASSNPTIFASSNPTVVPNTPTITPSMAPSILPTTQSSSSPTALQSSSPTALQSSSPTALQSSSPSSQASQVPSQVPSQTPTPPPTPVTNAYCDDNNSPITYRSPNCDLGSQPGYQICMEFLNMPCEDAPLFDEAIEFWESAVTNDIPDHSLPLNFLVQDNFCGPGYDPPDPADDLFICGKYTPIDGASNVLGTGSTVNDGSGIPKPTLWGMLKLDTADRDRLQGDRQMYWDVVVHEIGHVLGVGNTWRLENQPLVNDNCEFIGPAATAVYRELSGCANGFPPVECTNGHWSEDCFDAEILTPIRNFGGVLISELTIASLDDIGYTTDRDAIEYDFFTFDMAEECRCNTGNLRSGGGLLWQWDNPTQRRWNAPSPELQELAKKHAPPKSPRISNNLEEASSNVTIDIVTTVLFWNEGDGRTFEVTV